MSMSLCVPGNCPEGHFNVAGRCVPCFCSGITMNCHSTTRYRSNITLRFTEEENFKGSRRHVVLEVLWNLKGTILNWIIIRCVLGFFSPHFLLLFPSPTLSPSPSLSLSLSGVNVSFPSRPGTPPPLSSTQMMVNPEEEEFQLVDLSRRFLDLESFWTLPRQFLGSKVILHSCGNLIHLNRSRIQVMPDADMRNLQDDVLLWN